MTFVVASNNKKKTLEISTILSCIGYTAISAGDAGIFCEPEETEHTFLGNALLKAKAFKEFSEYPVIADDSGLMAEALDGLPGVMTARYAGIGATDEENIDKLLKEMKDVKQKDRTAWFVSAVATVLKDGSVITALGYTRGYIGYERRGDNGFGYDPIFYVEGNRSFAQLSDIKKNSISHRGRALRKLVFKLRNIERMKGQI